MECKKCKKDKSEFDFYKRFRVCKDCTKENVKTWRYKNKEKVKIAKKKWKKNNPEKIKRENRLYRQRRKANDLLFSLRLKISKKIKKIIDKKDFIKSKSTFSILGCSPLEFKQYIESKWEPWMNWDNYGLYNGTMNYGWDLDHIVPISSGKNEEELIKLNHYTNFQPLCSYINRHIKINN